MKQTKQKLPGKLKKKWVVALRSGKYKQGTRKLYDPLTNSHCCLGVLGRICGYKNEKLDGHVFLHDFTFPVVPSILQNGYSKDNPLPEKLSSFNDNGKSFKWIAAYIERYL